MKKFLIGLLCIANLLFISACSYYSVCKKCGGDGHVVCSICNGNSESNGRRCVNCTYGIDECYACDGKGKVLKD